MAMFEFVSMALSEAFIGVASSIVGGGGDEDKETMQDRFNRMFKRAYTNTTASLLSPAPLLDKVVIYLLNQGLEKGKDLISGNKSESEEWKSLSKSGSKKKGMMTPWEQPKKKKDEGFFYEDKGYANTPVSNILNYVGGAPGVALRSTLSIFNNMDRLLSDQYKDVFGNDVEFSTKDKMLIAGAFAFQILAAGNRLPAEAERIANSVVIEVEKGARKRKQGEWKPLGGTK
jgi:hypothetical protein